MSLTKKDNKFLDDLINGIVRPTEPFAIMYALVDKYPYEVVKVISARTIEVRKMDSEIVRAFKPQLVGKNRVYFYDDGTLKYEVKSNPNNEVIRIRRSKKNNTIWKKGRTTFILSEEPERHHSLDI